ncbi:AAA family ATPase [Candidatus Uhrbacteria bacterium]|nr:AAA family ATPase [Candidatus Uhrbacteria bacterium]
MTQEEALAILKSGESVFLTGEPGSGKSHTVNQYVRWLRDRGVSVVVTASTGIAATHIGGRTVHSWSGIGVKGTLTSSDIRAIEKNARTAKNIKKPRALIIDELSMLSADTLTAVETVCRKVRGNEEPFGGLQVVLVGDFFQLPPVVRFDPAHHHQQTLLSTEQNRSPFAFSSPAWSALNPTVCYLSEQHRQEDPVFLDLLTALRNGVFTDAHRALLRSRPTTAPHAGITQLFTHNIDVDRINNVELTKLSGEVREFAMTSVGPSSLVVQLRRGCLSPENLQLKNGAVVMFTKNDPTLKFVNGTTGRIIGFSKETGAPLVQTRAGRVVSAEPADWSIDDGTSVLARITQVPLRLAWALTVHKSQGMSLDAAHMDLSRVFEYGQGYVALSRVRTLAGLTLVGINERALHIHPEVRAQDAAFRTHSTKAQERIAMLSDSIRARSAIHAHKKKRKKDTLSETKLCALRGRSIAQIAAERALTAGTIVHHLEQLVQKGALIPSRDLPHIAPSPDRLAQIRHAFERTRLQESVSEQEGGRDGADRIKLSPARALLGESFTFDELRLARLFLYP